MSIEELKQAHFEAFKKELAFLEAVQHLINWILMKKKMSGE